MHNIGELDKKLLELLLENARTSVSQLAKQLGVSRLTVQSHMSQLERSKVIQGYTLRWHESFLGQQISAHILIATDQKLIGKIVRALEKISVIKSLSSISGEFDLVAQLKAASTQELDEAMDAMTQITGVTRTQTSVLLSKKFER